MLTIYGVPVSVHTRKVIVTALEKKLPFRSEPVIPFNPPPGWSELSPTGKIPVATFDDFTVCDSSVICAYLERVHPQPALYPAEPRAYAQALWLEEYADGTLFREVLHGLFFQQVIRPNMLGQPTDRDAIAQIESQALPRTFGYLQSAIAGEFAVAEQFTIADIAIVSNLINFHYLGYRLGPEHEQLAAYFRRHLQRPAIAAALDREAPAAAAMNLAVDFGSQLA